MIDKNCLSYWFPKLESSGVPVPRTEILTTDAKLECLLDGKRTEGLTVFEDSLLAACRRVGWPVFLRTGQGSNKHDWEKSCCVQEPGKILEHVVNLVEWSHMVDMLGLPHHVWVVREMLPTTPLFHAFSGRMPICREWRCFYRGGRHTVACVHPYWPEDSIWGADTKDFAARLRTPATVSESEVVLLATKAGASVSDGENWSIDVLETTRGLYVTDMALAEQSYHDPECRALA